MLCKSIGNHTFDAIFSSVSSLSLSVGIAYRQNFRNHTFDAIFSSVSSLSLSVGIAYRQNFRFE